MVPRKSQRILEDPEKPNCGGGSPHSWICGLDSANSVPFRMSSECPDWVLQSHGFFEDSCHEILWSDHLFLFWIWFLFILSHRQNWGQVGFLRKRTTDHSKRMRRAWKTMGPPPRMMPQYWTAHRSSLTPQPLAEWSSYSRDGVSERCPNDAQSMEVTNPWIKPPLKGQWEEPVVNVTYIFIESTQLQLW